MQSILTPENVEKFKQIHELVNSLNEKHTIDKFYQIERASSDIITMFETHLENIEKKEESLFEEIKQYLLRTNSEFQKLNEKHQELDERIVCLETRLYLEPEEEIEEKQLKVDKLRLKDKMAEIIHQYRNS